MRRAALLLITGLAGMVEAQEEGPDLRFLEYLGSWDEGDEEWLIVAEIDQGLEADDEGSERADDEKDEADESDEK